MSFGSVGLKQDRYMVIAVSIGLLGLVLSDVSGATWIAEGTRLEWQMTVPDGWYGGNYYQIDEKLRAAIKENPSSLETKLLKALKEEARYADALLINLEPEIYPPCPSRLRIQLQSEDGYRAFQELGLVEVSHVIEKTIQTEQPSMTKVITLRVEDNLTTAGYPAHRLSFEITKSSGEVSFEVWHFVNKDGSNHIFRLSADQRVADRRLRQFDQMLHTLTYKDQIEGREKNWYMTLKPGWLGGNYNEIEKALRSTSGSIATPETKKTLEWLKEAAMQNDVILYYSPDAKMVRVESIIQGYWSGGFVSIEKMKRLDNQSRIDLIRKRYSNDCSIGVEVVEQLKTGGYPSQRTIFKINKPNGVNILEVVQTVFLMEKQRNHVLRLRVDSNVANERLKEFDDMLQSITYR